MHTIITLLGISLRCSYSQMKSHSNVPKFAYLILTTFRYGTMAQEILAKTIPRKCLLNIKCFAFTNRNVKIYNHSHDDVIRHTCQLSDFIGKLST